MFSKLYKFSKLVMYLNSCSMDLGRDTLCIFNLHHLMNHHTRDPHKLINDPPPPQQPTIQSTLTNPIHQRTHWQNLLKKRWSKPIEIQEREGERISFSWERRGKCWRERKKKGRREKCSKVIYIYIYILSLLATMCCCECVFQTLLLLFTF